MGTCACTPSMQGIRCGARLRQSMETQLVKQLWCSAGPGGRGSKVGEEGRRCLVQSPNDDLRPRKGCSLSNFNPCFPQSSRGSRNKNLGGSVPVFFPRDHGPLCWDHDFQFARSFKSPPCCPQSSHGSRSKNSGGSVSVFSPRDHWPPCWDYGIHSTRSFNSGLGSPSRIASFPRVTSFQPDRAWVESQTLCPGCGIEMQDEDPKAPGFFQHPVQRAEDEEEVLPEAFDDEELNFPAGEAKKWEERSSPEFDFQDENDPRETRRARKGLVGRSYNRSRRAGQDRAEAADSEKPTVCARCHALRNYGRVKDESMENLLPDFDFEHVVGSRLRKSIGRRAVVVMVIDSVDFDGSFPRTAANLLAEAEKELGHSWQEGQAGNVARLLIVLNKVDLLPGQISPVRLEQWVRRRSRAGGVSQISGVHIVSAFKGWGMDKLSKQIIELAGPRGDVWVIGAQNVGKSSLINALGKVTAEGAEGKKNTFLTEAAVPGTTIGVLKLEGILPGRARLLDTPGLLHPHQITTRLTREEQKMVQIRKILKPRTFRVKVGHAISVGGLVRLIVESAPGESIYATVWASAYIPCHMGKGETAQELYDKHVGEKLQPPLSKERVDELGRWVARTVQVSGHKWDKSSVDVAVAGIGWIALALSGSATVQIWTYEGVAVTVREAIVFDLALVMEKPGFTPMKGSGKGQI